MLSSIQMIVHPFCGPRSPKFNPHYIKLAQRVLADKSSHLLVLPYREHPAPQRSKIEGPTSETQAAELEYLSEDKYLHYICDVFDAEPQRVSLLASNNPGSPFYRGQNLIHLTDHPWFTETTAVREPSSFISTDYQTIFHRWIENDPLPPTSDPRKAFMHVQIDGDDYVKIDIQPQTGKILRRLPRIEQTVKLDGEMRILINSSQTDNIYLIAHGLFYTSCVLMYSAAFALILGIPLRNIELSTEQYEGSEAGGPTMAIPDHLRFPFRQGLDGLGIALSYGWQHLLLEKGWYDLDPLLSTE